MKKLLAMLLAGLLLITSMSVMAWADDEDPIDDSFEPYTYVDFRDKVVSACNADEVDVLELGFSGYGMRQMGIYLPEGIGLEDITEIYLYPSYLAVGFEHDDVYMQLYFFYTTYGETSSYETMKKYDQAITTDDGTGVYYRMFVSNEEYYWLDGDKTFCLRVRTTENSCKYLDLCKAVFHSFDEDMTFSLEAAASIGKVRLSWDELGGDETYTVYYKRSSSDTWKVAGTTSKHKVNITGLKSSVSYDFKIEATGVESEIVTVTAE